MMRSWVTHRDLLARNWEAGAALTDEVCARIRWSPFATATTIEYWPR